MADLEDLVLSGRLFDSDSRSSSPPRSPSPDAAKWPDDAGYDSEQENRDHIRNAIRAQEDEGQQQSIGMGPGRTGVKGVIRDRNEAASSAKLKRAKEVEELNRQMEKASLGGKTFLEEEREKALEANDIEGMITGQHISFFNGNNMGRGRFGHLREVGLGGFLRAIESEDRGVWVVVHIYDPSLERCISLDDSLGRLARQHTSVKFLRAKASALGFASTSTTSRTSPSLSSSISRSTKSALMPSKYKDDDDDDPYADEPEKVVDGEEEINDDEVEVDTDMLPTLLVYQDGDLVYNWVRVDWEAGRSEIGDFLVKHRVLPVSKGNCGLPSDDEDDLTFSDDD